MHMMNVRSCAASVRDDVAASIRVECQTSERDPDA